MASFLSPFFLVLLLILDIIKWIVLVWVIISWLLFFAHNSSFRWRNRGAYHILEQLNDICSRMAWPFVRPIRRMLRRVNTAGIDWSPLVLLIIIYFLQLMIRAIAARAILGV
jgi:YggT family protein